jgi:hypothetical protein
VEKSKELGTGVLSSFSFSFQWILSFLTCDSSDMSFSFRKQVKRTRLIAVKSSIIRLPALVAMWHTCMHM